MENKAENPVFIIMMGIKEWGSLRGTTYVPSLNFKTFCLAYWGGSHVADGTV